MAQSINIGTLAVHNFCVGEDHGIVQYDKTKADQTREKVHNKHFYDNLKDSLVSIFLALGVWFSLGGSQFEKTENPFQVQNMSQTLASQRHYTQLCKLL